MNYFNDQLAGATFGGDKELRAINKNREPEKIFNHRYTLWRLDPEKAWEGISLDQKLHRMVAFIGLNPSTALPEKLDPTVTRCERFAKDWGYDGFIMLNIFSYRATSPTDMKRAKDPTGDPVNIDAIRGVCQQAGRVVCCWGNHGVHLNRGNQVRDILQHDNIDLKHLGLCKTGQPKHPLYLKATTKPISF